MTGERPVHVADLRCAARSTRLAAVADAVLFEGYLLYPYRASAQKNRLRWQFGVLTPPGFPDEPDRSRTEVLLERRPGAVLHLRLRFLQLRARTVHDAEGRPVDELVDGDERHFPWEEGVPREVDAVLPVDGPGEHTVPFALPAEHTAEPVAGGRVERRCLPLNGRLVVAAEPLPGPYDVLRLRVDVVNDSACPDGAPREVALRTSLIAAHTLSPSPRARSSRPPTRPSGPCPRPRALDNRHTWPVLAGPEGRSDLLLSSPIILADHPQLAPESPTDLFDGTEIDEILSLRTLVLTDEEKAEARATDPRAAAVVDAVDAMPPEIWERLHGAIRTAAPARPARQAPGTTSSAPGTTPVFATDVPWWDPGRRRLRRSRDRRRPGRRHAGRQGQPGAAAAPPGRRRPGPLPRRPARPRCTPCCTTSTARCTSPSPSTATRPRSCRSRTAGSGTSTPTRSRWSVTGCFPERVLVAGVGNVFLSDDGFGVEVARRLAGRDLPAGVEVADIGIRGMHLAYRLLDGYRALVLVDTVRQGHPPGTLYLLEHDLDGPADEAARFDAHGMEPGAVLLDARPAGAGRRRRATRRPGARRRAASPRPSTRGSGCPNRWPRSSTGRRRRSSTWSATCSMRRIKMIKLLLVAAIVVAVAAAATQTPDAKRYRKIRSM